MASSFALFDTRMRDLDLAADARERPRIARMGLEYFSMNEDSVPR